MGISQKKLLLGLIGAGIQASRTPAMHEHEAAEHGIRCIYQLIDIEKFGISPGWLPELMLAAERMGFSGLNITHPYKQEVVRLLTEFSPAVSALGAANTVLFRNGKRIGYNTDWWGFAENLRQGLPDAPIEHVVQLGAGGAGAATAYGALKHGVKKLSIFDVDPEREERLVDLMGLQFGKNRVEMGENLAATVARADGLIHATPTGMTKHPGLPLPETLLRPDLWVAEIVYFPLETELLQVARRMGCRTIDGTGMAIYQAVRSFELFTGIIPETERMARTFAEAGNAVSAGTDL